MASDVTGVSAKLGKLERIFCGEAKHPFRKLLTLQSSSICTYIRSATGWIDSGLVIW